MNAQHRDRAPGPIVLLGRAAFLGAVITTPGLAGEWSPPHPASGLCVELDSTSGRFEVPAQLGIALVEFVGDAVARSASWENVRVTDRWAFGVDYEAEDLLVARVDGVKITNEFLDQECHLSLNVVLTRDSGALLCAYTTPREIWQEPRYVDERTVANVSGAGMSAPDYSSLQSSRLESSLTTVLSSFWGVCLCDLSQIGEIVLRPRLLMSHFPALGATAEGNLIPNDKLRVAWHVHASGTILRRLSKTSFHTQRIVVIADDGAIPIYGTWIP